MVPRSFGDSRRCRPARTPGSCCRPATRQRRPCGIASRNSPCPPSSTSHTRSKRCGGSSRVGDVTPGMAGVPRAAVDRARRLLGDAERVVVLTGAGVSAESGVPTFRGAGGLWKEHRAEDLATPDAFARDPRLVWEWYGWRRRVVSQCVPNAAHVALASAARVHDDFRIVTQNVDGLHSVAAADSPRAAPLELHGCLFRLRCTRCGKRRDDRGVIDATSRATLPACAACEGLERPDIVWFGEALEPAVIGEAVALAS